MADYPSIERSRSRYFFSRATFKGTISGREPSRSISSGLRHLRKTEKGKSKWEKDYEKCKIINPSITMMMMHIDKQFQEVNSSRRRRKGYCQRQLYGRRDAVLAIKSAPRVSLPFLLARIQGVNK